jgi:hypothetical protein
MTWWLATCDKWHCINYNATQWATQQCWIINYRVASKCIQETIPVYISPPHKQVEWCEQHKHLNVVQVSTSLFYSMFQWYRNDAIQIQNRFNLVCPVEHPTGTWTKVDNKWWSINMNFRRMIDLTIKSQLFFNPLCHKHVRYSAGATDFYFSLLHVVQTACWSHLASHVVDISSCYPELRWQMCETNHPLQSRTHIKNEWSHRIILSMPSQHAERPYLYFLLAHLLL